MEPIISISNLTVRFGQIEALSDVSLDIFPGSITGIIGPNGAGKTTLFHAITGDLGRTAEVQGTIRMMGQDCVGWKAAKIAAMGFGKQFQDGRIFRNMTVRDNLLTAAYTAEERQWYSSFFRLSGDRRRELDRQIKETVEKIGIQGSLAQLAGELSFGQQKLLAFGRLLIAGFKVFLLDEPMSGLTEAAADRLTGLITAAAREGGTVLLIEHNIASVRRLCCQTVALNAGRVVQQGPTEDLLGDDSIRHLCLGL